MWEEIVAEAHKILEETKKEQEKYSNERMIIFELIEEKNEENIDILKGVIEMIKKIRSLAILKNDYDSIIAELKEIKEQNVRKSDEKKAENINLFEIKDKDDNSYTFFSRENAKVYIKENQDNFDEKQDIIVVKNNNMDIEKIFNMVKI